MRIARLLPLLLLPGALACSEADKDDDDDDDDDEEVDDTGATAGDDTGGGGGGGGGGTPADPLDALQSELPDDTSDCETVEGQSVSGALSAFIGTYTDGGDGTWSGGERWVLHANAAWRDTGVSDCHITWRTVAAEITPPASCPTCDLGLDIVATLDEGATTCPEELWEDDTTFITTYGVRRDGGVSTWVFGSSGSQMGTGGADTAQVDFATESACVWF